MEPQYNWDEENGGRQAELNLFRICNSVSNLVCNSGSVQNGSFNMYFRLSPRIEGIDILSSFTSRDIFGDNADGPKVDYFLLLRYIVIKLAARVHCMGRRCCYWTKRRWCPSFGKCNDHRSRFTHFIWLSGTVVQNNGAVLFDCSMLECALPIYVMLCRAACSLFHRRSLSLHRTMLRYLTHVIWFYTPHVPT